LIILSAASKLNFHAHAMTLRRTRRMTTANGSMISSQLERRERRRSVKNSELHRNRAGMPCKLA